MTLATDSLNIDNVSSQTIQLQQLLETFLQTLQTEADQLKSSDVDALQATLLQKESQSEAITEVTEKLNAIFEPHQLSLTALISDTSLAIPAKTKQHIESILLLSDQCNTLNQANGMAIQILSGINQQALNLFSGNSNPNVKLYGSTGETTRPDTHKQSLGKA